MAATTLTAGSIYTYLVNSSGRMTLTPGGGGTVTILSRDSADDANVPRSISAAETLPLRASSTISFQAVGVDATWEFFPFDSAENMAWVQSSVSGGGNAKSPKTYLLFDGDSKSAEPKAALQWYVSKAPSDVEFGSDLGVGGSRSDSAGTGLTSASRLALMASTVAAQVALNKDVDIYLTIGTNDLATNTAEVVAANVDIYYDAFIAAGGRNLNVMAVDPRNGSTATLNAANAALLDLCLTRARANFVDTFPALLDQAAATNDPIGGSGGGTGTVRGAVTRDGLHCSGFGKYSKMVAIEPVAAGVYRRRLNLPMSSVDIYNATSAKKGNLLGVSGRILALGGTAGATNGTEVNTPPLLWTSSGDMGGGVTVTYSATTSATAQAALGLTAAPKCVRVTLSGTAVAAGLLQLNRTVTGLSGVGPDSINIQILGAFNAVSGVSGVKCWSNLVSNGLTASLGTEAGRTTSDEMVSLTQLLWMEDTKTEGGNPSTVAGNVALYWPAGAILSGSIDLIGVCIRKSPVIA